MKINFDMDGTIANFYDVPNWLEYLLNEDVKPYREAKPLLNMSIFARYVNRLQSEGIQFGIISWGSKTASNEYLEAITEAKVNWLKKHCASIHWNTVSVIPYGSNKAMYLETEADILFDDEENNRKVWNEEGGIAYTEKQIMEVLKGLVK